MTVDGALECGVVTQIRLRRRDARDFASVERAERVILLEGGAQRSADQAAQAGDEDLQGISPYQSVRVATIERA